MKVFEMIIPLQAVEMQIEEKARTETARNNIFYRHMVADWDAPTCLTYIVLLLSESEGSMIYNLNEIY